MSRFRRTPRVGLRLLSIAALMVVSVVAFSNAGSARPDVVLTSGTDFSVTGAITPWPACSGSTADLDPGVTDCLTYTIFNPLKAAITVQSLAVSASSLPPECPASVLDLSSADFNGSLTVPAGQSASVSEPISMLDNGNQDDCEGLTLNFEYSGSAVYTEVYATTTALTSSSDPSTVGQEVTYTATVTATAASGQDPVPSDPTGTVSFFDSGTPISGCSAVSLTAGPLPTAGASCTVTYSEIGSHSITASFKNADGNFTVTGSSSSIVVEEVDGADTPSEGPTTTNPAVSTTTTTPVAPTTTTTDAPSPTPAPTPTTPVAPTTTTTDAPSPTPTPTTTPTPPGSGSGLAFTGAQITWLVTGGLALFLAGLLMVGLGRRREESATSEVPGNPTAR